MRLKTKDFVAILLAAAIAVPYIGWLIDGDMPFVKDPRGMSAVGLILGVAAFLVLRRGDPVDRVGKAEIALAVVAVAVGITALVLAETAAAAAWLAVFMGLIGLVVVVELVDHAGVLPGHDHRDATAHA